MSLVLASQSPRRKEILGYFSIPFTVRPTEFDEDSIPFTGEPEAYAMELARGKANAVEAAPDELILAADTIVYCEGKVYGKPSDADEAFQILQELSGAWHTVYTGVALLHNGTVYDDCEETRVLFNAPTEEQMRGYHKALHCFDKAGGYAIQESGALMVRAIEGCYYNVMGLPINAVNTLLSQVGHSLWNYLD